MVMKVSSQIRCKPNSRARGQETNKLKIPLYGWLGPCTVGSTWAENEKFDQDFLTPGLRLFLYP